MNIPSMTWVSTFGLTVACGNRPLSDLSTFKDAVLNTGGARLLLFVSVFEVATTASDALILVVVVAGDEVVVVVLVTVPAAAVDAIDEMLTVIATVDEVTAADEADVTNEMLDVVTGVAVDIFSLARECDSIGFGNAFTFEATEIACDTLVGVALIKSVEENDSKSILNVMHFDFNCTYRQLCPFERMLAIRLDWRRRWSTPIWLAYSC